MKRFIVGIICATIILITGFSANKISDFIASKIGNDKHYEITESNNYSKSEGFSYVKLQKDLTPYSYNDLLNVIFTIINSGETNYSFYCPSQYTDCINDMYEISDDSLILTHINNFVHPFNSFTHIETSVYESGEIKLNITHVYNNEQIDYINQEVDKIIESNYDKNKKDYDNIKKIHDYIINNTKYDESAKENNQNDSNTAYGTLKNHLATCNGYTDLMAIILDRLNIKNYKIATTADRISYDATGHIWNAVYIDGKWLHLDLTWDDPVSETKEDYLYHKYFLVNNEELKKSDSGDVTIEEHNFDPKIYLEFNDSIKDIISS